MRRWATAAVGALALGGCASVPASVPPAAHAAPASQPEQVEMDPGEAPAANSVRWLYGSGEAAGVSIQAWRALADYAITLSKTAPSRSVTLGLPGLAGGTGTTSCVGPDGTRKPYAAVFDVDETVILNRGYAYWSALGHNYSLPEWGKWASGGAPYVAPVPGAVTAIHRLREGGIAVVFNTNRDAKTASGTADAIAAAGLGRAVHGKTLFMRGDDKMGGRKDGRRAMIAEKYCILALAGDNLGDFADLFNEKGLSIQERRALAAHGALAKLWGNGWFAMPNPTYGASIRGSVNDVFPPEDRWTPVEPADAGKK